MVSVNFCWNLSHPNSKDTISKPPSRSMFVELSKVILFYGYWLWNMHKFAWSTMISTSVGWNWISPKINETIWEPFPNNHSQM
jgi:hypothetical protein